MLPSRVASGSVLPQCQCTFKTVNLFEFLKNVMKTKRVISNYARLDFIDKVDTFHDNWFLNRCKNSNALCQNKA